MWIILSVSILINKYPIVKSNNILDIHIEHLKIPCLKQGKTSNLFMQHHFIMKQKFKYEFKEMFWLIL